MRKHLLLWGCLLAAAAPVFTQGYYTNFHDVVQQSCPYDPSMTVTFPEGWTVYQTADGTWDGVAQERCISVEDIPGGNIRIDLGQIDPTQPLFLRLLPSELADQNELPVNELMVVDFFWGSGFGNELQLGAACTEDLCSGVFLGIDVGVPGAMRVHTGILDENNYEHFCFPTEYFSGQFLRELILKFTFSPDANLSGSFLELYGITVSPAWGFEFETGLISEVPANSSQYNNATDEYDVLAFEAANTHPFADQFLMVYTEPTFPSVQTPSYVTGSVDPPSDQQETINLIIEEWQTLEIQPFTQLRGELVQGSDSLRHLVNLVNNGGELCYNFLDLIFSGGNQYRHGPGGIIDVHNSFSCMQFRQGSALRVLENATLHYGTAGAGMLALCADSRFELEPGATLLVDAILNIAECDDALPPSHITMDLPKNTSLIFTENARVTNRFSQGQQMELRVRMLGGTLDDSRLPAEDRALIRRVYPEAAPDFAANFSVSPNPINTTPALSYVSAGTETLSLQWLSTDGKLLQASQWTAQQGFNEWTLENTPAAAGCYWLRVANGRESAVLKVVRVE